MISQPAPIVRSLLCIAVLVLAATGCSTQQSASRSPSASIGGQAADVALQQVGVPYRYGGATPKGFDCSGLVQYSYSRVGKSVPRTTKALWKSAQPVSQYQMRAGDLLFFKIAGKMSHVGMYIGDDRFVHAPSTGKVVSVASLRSDYYRKAFIRAGRPE